MADLTKAERRNQLILKLVMLGVAAMFVLGGFASIMYGPST